MKLHACDWGMQPAFHAHVNEIEVVKRGSSYDIKNLRARSHGFAFEMGGERHNLGDLDEQTVDNLISALLIVRGKRLVEEPKPDAREFWVVSNGSAVLNTEAEARAQVERCIASGSWAQGGTLLRAVATCSPGSPKWSDR